MNVIADFWRAEAHYNATRSPEDALKVADAAISAIDRLSEELETAQHIQHETEKDNDRYFNVLKDIREEIFSARPENYDEVFCRIESLLDKIF
jgi:uncharacterized protein YpuA (DUF1002 family)